MSALRTDHAPSPFLSYVEKLDWKRAEAASAIYGELGFDMADRLRGPNAFGAAYIYNLRALLKWARERWPDWYTRRSDDWDGVTGERALQYLWAGYLCNLENGNV